MLSALLLGVAPVRGATPPRLWSWQPPLGAARRSGPFVLMVRTMVTPDAEAVADTICRTIQRRQLRETDIAIVLQNFGVGDGDPARRRADLPALFNHERDGLIHHRNGLSGMPLTPWWRTPWMSNGIAEQRDWMTRFIRRYRENQRNDATLPDPGRFHFDSEESPTAGRKGTIRVFLALQLDPRYDREQIPGHGSQTLKALYEAAGSPMIDPKRAFYHRNNHAFTNWYGGILRQASDAAMNAAAYQLIRDAWPNCQSSNYGTSERFDGVNGRYRRNTRHRWLQLVTRPSADLSAPVLYFTPRLAKNGVTHADAMVREAAQRLDGCILSFGGPHDDVVPWTFPVGFEVDGLVADEHMIARIYALFRSRGITEAILWSDTTTQNAPGPWNATARVVSEVWSMTPRRLSVQAGELEMTEGRRLLRAHDGGATVTATRPGDSGSDYVATVTVQFKSNLTRWASDRRLRLIIGGTLLAESAVTTEIRVRNHNDSTLPPRITVPCSATLIDTSLDPGPGVLAPDGSIEVQLHFTSTEPFSMNFDWLQAFPVASGPKAPTLLRPDETSPRP